MRLCQFSVFFILVLFQSQIVNAQAIIANHTTVDITLIPDDTISLASALKVVVRRASVGGNIDGGLTAIQTENIKYDRSRWVFSDRGNPGWQAKVNDFSAYTAAHISEYDIFSMKFCWVDPDAIFACYRDTLLQLESRYPAKRFIWWTMPIMNSANVDTNESHRQAFNNNVRNYAADHRKILFDIADIEAYNATGVKKIDGSGNELQQDDWSQLDGGHLNTAGARRVASAWWWLMARVAGWNGSLPVQMTSFTASVRGMSAELHWSTATEINNYGFEIEKRTVKSEQQPVNGWQKVGFIAGNGTSNAPHEYIYSDSRLEAGRYVYRLKQIDNDAKYEYSRSIEVEVGVILQVFTVEQNYPNPFNPTTTFEFSLAKRSNVSLKIFDILGREVTTLIDSELEAGILHQVKFDASKLSSGMYFYRLEAGKDLLVKKLVLIK